MTARPAEVWGSWKCPKCGFRFVTPVRHKAVQHRCQPTSFRPTDLVPEEEVK